MTRSIIGVLILILLVVVGVAVRSGMSKAAPVTLKGLVGGEKTGFLDDPDVKKILLRRYGVAVDYAKAGSIEMVRSESAGQDFLWPSSQVALELYKERFPQIAVKSDLIFSSPLVLYSWDLVVAALVKGSFVTQRDSVYYMTDFPRLLRSIIAGKKWSDIGMADLYGRISLICTDPVKSNSGSLFAGLLATILCCDQITDSSLGLVMPSVKAYFAGLGFMEQSSSDLFNQYLSTGMGAKPIIAGYENQIIEFSLANQQLWPAVREKVKIVYPEPTVWSAHPFIAVTARAERLMKALKDPDIQKLAWERHGFRSGMLGTQNDPAVLRVGGIPARIVKVIPLPSPRTMDRLLAELGAPN